MKVKIQPRKKQKRVIFWLELFESMDTLIPRLLTHEYGISLHLFRSPLLSSAVFYTFQCTNLTQPFVRLSTNIFDAIVNVNVLYF